MAASSSGFAPQPDKQQSGPKSGARYSASPFILSQSSKEKLIDHVLQFSPTVTPILNQLLCPGSILDPTKENYVVVAY